MLPCSHAPLHALLAWRCRGGSASAGGNAGGHYRHVTVLLGTKYVACSQKVSNHFPTSFQRGLVFFEATELGVIVLATLGLL